MLTFGKKYTHENPPSADTVPTMVICSRKANKKLSLIRGRGVKRMCTLNGTCLYPTTYLVHYVAEICQSTAVSFTYVFKEYEN